jgi:hypothetical protein
MQIDDALGDCQFQSEAALLSISRRVNVIETIKDVR